MKKITLIMLTLIAMQYSASSLAMKALVEVTPKLLVATLKTRPSGLIPSYGILRITTPEKNHSFKFASETVDELTRVLKEQDPQVDWRASAVVSLTPKELNDTSTCRVILCDKVPKIQLQNNEDIRFAILRDMAKAKKQWIVIANESLSKEPVSESIEYFN